jgi:hypothetical protein
MFRIIAYVSREVRIRSLVSLALLTMSSLPLVAQAPPSADTFVSKVGSKTQVAAAYGKLPLTFEPNQGQTKAQVKFLSRGSGYSLFLTPQEAVLSFAAPRSAKALNAKDEPARLQKFRTPTQRVRSSMLRMSLVGANPSPVVTSSDELPGKSNYFLGSDPKKWRTGVSNYAKVQYRNVYPGVDLVYYGNRGQLEHDFVVAPGGDPSTIAIQFRGAQARY